MKAINSFLDACRAGTRVVMKKIAIGLYRATNGRLSANMVTLIGLFAHILIALLIGIGNFPLAAALLLIFGLFDALDGEIARLQNKDSSAGMLLDASTDRFKEVMLYSGIAYSLVHTGNATAAVWAVAACGASLCVSYVKAKGETAVAKSGLTTTEVNRLFQDGFLRFELRMFLLILGLVFNALALAVITIAVLASLTAVQRLYLISQKLNV